MAGFFEVDTIEKVKPVQRTIPACGSCGLKRKCISGPLKPVGKGKKKILIIGQAPSKKEDSRGRLLKGAGTEILSYELEKYGIDLWRDCLKMNAIKCYTKKQKIDHLRTHINACRPHVLKVIKEYKPKLIIVAGGAAIESIIGHRVSQIGSINKWRGYCIPDREFKAWVCPVYHPNFLRNDKTGAAEMVFEQDINLIQYHLKKPVPTFPDESKNVKILDHAYDIQQFLIRLLKNPPPLAAIDWETTGLKPHHPNHKIVSCAITHKPDHAVAFMVTNRIRKLLCKFLTCGEIKKIAANLKFEEVWSREKLGVSVAGWIWDTMLAEHVLDNRSGITGLKFQTYVHYGLDNYDGHLSHLLTSDDKSMGKNAFNKIHKIPVRELLIYNGLDTIFEYRRAIDQMKRFGILDPLHYAKNYRG